MFNLSPSANTKRFYTFLNYSVFFFFFAIMKIYINIITSEAVLNSDKTGTD